jgi:hypothetical protein
MLSPNYQNIVNVSPNDETTLRKKKKKKKNPLKLLEKNIKLIYIYIYIYPKGGKLKIKKTNPLYKKKK